MSYGPPERATGMAGNTSTGGFKVGRDAKTGRFIPVKEAERRSATAVVETLKKPPKQPK